MRPKPGPKASLKESILHQRSLLRRQYLCQLPSLRAISRSDWQAGWQVDGRAGSWAVGQAHALIRSREANTSSLSCRPHGGTVCRSTTANRPPFLPVHVPRDPAGASPRSNRPSYRSSVGR